MPRPDYKEPTLVRVFTEADVRMEVWRLMVHHAKRERFIHNFNLLREIKGRTNPDGTQAYSKRFWKKHTEALRNVLLDFDEEIDRIEDGEVDPTLAETPPWKGQ